MMCHIVRRQALKGYRLRLTFQNGVERTLDFEGILVGPVFGPLRNLRKFRRVKINRQFGCLEWPNGADLCPDALYRGYPKEIKNCSPKGSRGRRIFLGETMAKRKCRTTYKVKVKSKKTGHWRWGLVGCNLKSMRRAVELYKEKFGEKAKIVKA